MKRMKKHKVKTEVPETSTSQNRDQGTHDLAYYIHDRVELMHQVFSVLKYKELKAMAPACIRNIPIDDLQELCTEELLGISSKRLCAILDGADPPSDTESSSPSPPPEQMETISLDSISSDDEILSQASSKKKKHKHRRRDSKSKSKRKKSKDEEEGEADKSKASRAGLTVLELLELQARARAIRAQLQQEQHNKPVSESAPTEPPHSSDNEVEIKEEPAEVVEISSDEEKPKIEELQKIISQEKDAEPQQPATVTKRINDLVITVPQNPKQKIKLNRNKAPAPTEKSSVTIIQNTSDKPESVATTKNVSPNLRNDKTTAVNKNEEKRKEKSRKKKKQRKSTKDDDDNDEITLQLSDTEKMDLLEDLDRKNYDSVSSDTSSDSSSDSDVPKKETSKKEGNLKEEQVKSHNKNGSLEDTENVKHDSGVIKPNSDGKDSELSRTNKNMEESPEKELPSVESEDSFKKTSVNISNDDIVDNEDETLDIDTTFQAQSATENTDTKSDIIEINLENEKEIQLVKETAMSDEKDSDSTTKEIQAQESKDENSLVEESRSQVPENEKNLSEGELSDRESSEVEAVDLKPEVVCISDEESGNKSKKKKKKKDKKSKKEKKSKKKSDFRENADQNFYKDSVEVIEDSSQEQIEKTASVEVIDNSTQSDCSVSEASIIKNEDIHTIKIVDKVDLTAVDNVKLKPTDNLNTDTKFSDDNQTIKNEVKSINTANSSNSISDDDKEEVYEILELSDDSCEIECTLLSKEPTTLEIEALSAKIDEIDRIEVITDKEIREYEEMEQQTTDDIENISWKDRYLDSNKVKRVMNTANILNTLRKKNKELKKKIEETKKENDEHEVQNEIVETEDIVDEPNILEGSIEHYNTLEASTKYVNPVKEASDEVPGDLKKDAKLLLKMYKKLLKYNDMNKKEDPNKKKKKKKKKNKKEVYTKEVVGDEDKNLGNNDGAQIKAINLENRLVVDLAVNEVVT